MTPTADLRIKQATLREEWSVATVQRLAWAMGRPASTPAAAPRAAAGGPSPRSTSRTPAAPADRILDPARRIRLIQALGRLAADPQASPAERALAAQRLTALRTSTYAEAC